MRRIKLTKGRWATVDGRFYEALSEHKWYCSKDGYAVRNVYRGNGKWTMIFMHNAVLQLAGIKIPRGLTVDHKSRRNRDNRLRNLRIATIAQNQWNSKRSSRNTSGFKGVCWNKVCQKWQAMIQVNRKPIYLGVFASKHKAAAV